ncbi:MAG: hypothetical protein L6R40_002928 [Gallowayella cf. fulva]|nr:MAG: hypothetical protein L6R40_002928 [Xanthomendoza cf. fulva]
MFLDSSSSPKRSLAAEERNLSASEVNATVEVETVGFRGIGACLDAMLRLHNLTIHHSQGSGAIRYTIANTSTVYKIRSRNICYIHDCELNDSSKRRTWQPSRGVQSSNVNPSLNLFQDQHGPDIFEYPEVRDKTSSVTTWAALQQLAGARCASSHSHAFDVPANLHRIEFSARSFDDRYSESSGQSRIRFPTRTCFMHSATSIYDRMKNLVDERLPRSPIACRLYDDEDEIYLSASTIMMSVSEPRQRKAIKTSPVADMGDSVAQLANNYQTRRDSLVLFRMKDNLQSSLTMLKEKFVDKIYTRWDLMQNAHVTAKGISFLSPGPELLNFVEHHFANPIISAWRSLRALQLMVSNMVDPAIISVSFAAETVQLKAASGSSQHSLQDTRWTEDPPVADQGLKNTSIFARGKTPKQQPIRDPRELTSNASLLSIGQGGTAQMDVSAASPGATPTIQVKTSIEFRRQREEERLSDILPRMNGDGDSEPDAPVARYVLGRQHVRRLLSRGKMQDAPVSRYVLGRQVVRRDLSRGQTQVRNVGAVKSKAHELLYGVYPNYLELRRISNTALCSLNVICRELSNLGLMTERDRNIIKVGMVIRKSETLEAAHEARYYCRLRERWDEVIRNPNRSEILITNLLAERDASVRRKLFDAFMSSWRAVDRQCLFYDLFARLYGPLRSKKRGACSKLVHALRLGCRDIRQLLWSLRKANSLPYPLLLLVSSMSAVRQAWYKMDDQVPQPGRLRNRAYGCFRSYRELFSSLDWLRAEVRAGPSSDSIVLTGTSLGQYLTERASEEQQMERVYTDTSVAVHLKPGDNPESRELEIQSPVYLPDSSNADGNIWSNSTQGKPHRPLPSAPTFPASQFPGSPVSNITIRKSTSAAFHTSTMKTKPSAMSTRTVEGHDEPEEPEGDSSDDQGMIRRPIGSPLGYHIPPERIRASMLTSRSSRSAYWQYSLYEGPKGEKVKVHYCKSLETTERIARLFLNESVIGFDIEWKPSATVRDGIRKNVALIQLASEERIALFHVARFSKDDTIESLVAPTVKEIMGSSAITKVGVSVKGDCSRLKRYMSIDSNGLLELSHLYKLVKFSITDVKKIDRRMVALAKQVEEHLMLPMYKDTSVRGSDWSKDLNIEQIYYAASDSYAGFQLYHILNNKRLSLSPLPPLPPHAELDLPIRLANGQTVADYQEAVPEDPSSDNEDKSSTSVLSTEKLAEDVVNLQIEENKPPPPEPKSAAPQFRHHTPSLSSHPSIIAANKWVAEYRASTANVSLTTNNNIPSTDATYPSLPSSSPAFTTTTTSSSRFLSNTTTPQRKPRTATPSSLRAYFLFHYHALSIQDIASLLRSPPLQKSTVASYVLDAARVEGLELDKARVGECEGVLGNERWARGLPGGR